MYEGKVFTSCHGEFPPGMIVQSEILTQEMGYDWLTVKLSSGVSRDVIVKDVKKIGEDNGKS